ncbi:energy transducer TonB [Roseivirga sp. E12]|uniref:energy transducer TonB n=1 Tax=Roseivirga sp. E12 TaxID=2819237 RepID=UPI001ABD15F8|nr:energy transducer TonB [Roseivirga sp. E12]MBO3700816.1 energy transducer TonB [Roseivirga sp. E12]
MEIKKNPKADLARKSALFMMIGLVTSLSITIIAFEWKSTDMGDLMDLGSVSDDFADLIDIPPTEQLPKEPPKVKHFQIIDVPDDEEIDEEIDIDLDIDITEDTEIDDVFFEPEPDEEIADEVMLFPEEQASFPGGLKAWRKFLNDNLKYPRQAKRMNLSGTVMLSFVVNKEGMISDIEVIREVGGGCDEEAVRVLGLSPRWNPGLQRGRAVKSRMNIRVVFSLR